jgi:cytochrome c biogenesis protein CcmG, thiol:disulfide interchange protein DsbE
VKRRWRWLLPVAAVPVLALLAYGFRLDPRNIPSPLVGRPAAAFALTAFDGTPVTLGTLRGKVVVVNFWASWCTECRTEQAALNRLWQRFRDAGVVVVGVNFEDATDDARQYVASSGASYPVVVDADSRTALAYGLRGVPETYVIDPRGRLVDRVIGPVTYARLAGRISDLLATDTP